MRLSAAIAATLAITLIVPAPVAGGNRAPRPPSTNGSTATVTSSGTETSATDDGAIDAAASGPRTEEAQPADPSAARARPKGAPSGPLQASVHYEDVVAHQNDRPRFSPGSIVSVRFVPRPGDPWPVDGRAARALPAARASGRQLYAQPNGSTVIPAESSVVSAPAAEATPDVSAGADSSAGADTTEPVALQAVVGDRLRREVFGFLPYWEVSASTLTLDYSTLSTIAYFGVGADSAGHLVKRDSDGSVSTGWGGWASSRMTSIINAAHAAHTRVVLTIQRFSWTSGQRAQTTTLLSSSTARATLAKEIAAAVGDRGADGVNLDFEPIPSGQTANFTAFVRQVRAALDERAPGYQLTFDSTGYVGNYDIAALTARGAADAVLVMGYDYRTGSAGYAGSIAPLNGPTYDLTDTLKAFLSRTSASKIILGLPYYGRVWSTVSDAYHATALPQGSTYGSSSAVTYASAVDLANAYGRRYDSLEQSAWTAYTRRNCSSCPLTWREVYYDDAQSLGMKYDFVNYSDLRGVGMWALGYDGTRPELYALLKMKFVNDRTRPLAGIVNIAPVSRNEGVYVDWTAVDDYTGITFYDVQVSRDGGAWAPWLTGTRASAGTYLGQSGHGYAFRVRAMDGVGNWSLWNVTSRWQATPALAVGGFATVAAASLTMRAGPSISADSLGTLAAGDLVTVTGGPVEADGYTWYQATGPLREWGNVAWTTQQGMWLAAGTEAEPYLQPAQSPNATTIDADITGLDAGAVHEASLTAATSTGTATSGTRSFSPNGDGIFDALRLTYNVRRPLETLTLRAYRLSGRTLAGERALPGTSAGQHAYDWDGLLSDAAVADGQYVVQVVGVRDGTSFAAPAANMADRVLNVASFTVTIDTTPPSIRAIGASSARFSPNRDGVKDRVLLTTTVSGSSRWTLEILDGSTLLGRVRGTGSTVRYSWDGRRSDGVRMPNGTYTIRVTSVDALGNRSNRTRTVTIDTVRALGSVRATVPGLPSGATPNSFSPDGDGSADRANLGWTFNESVAGKVWVRSSRGTVWVKTVGWGNTRTVSWNGRAGSGASLPDGTYALYATVRDAAGNLSQVRSTVNLNRTIAYLRGSRLINPADGDSLAATGTFTFVLRKAAAVTLRVRGADGYVVRTALPWATRRAGNYSVTWNGRDDTGRLLPAGWYYVQLVADRDRVRQVLTRGVTSDAFAVELSGAQLTAGDSLTVLAQSAEPLAGAPTITLAQTGLSVQTATAAVQADGRWKTTFTIAPAGIGAAQVTVAGQDTAGGDNVASRAITVV